MVALVLSNVTPKLCNYKGDYDSPSDDGDIHSVSNRYYGAQPRLDRYCD